MNGANRCRLRQGAITSPSSHGCRSHTKNFPPLWETSPSRLRLPGRAGTNFSKRGNSRLWQVLLLLQPFVPRERAGSGQQPPPKFDQAGTGSNANARARTRSSAAPGAQPPHPRCPAAKSLPSPGAAPGTQHIPGAAGRGAAGPRAARHELASARHRVRKGLTHSLAGCHSAKLLTNSLLTAPAAAQRAPALRLRAASPGGDFPGGPGCDPPCQRPGRARIVRQRVENQTGITGETLRSA